MNPLRKLCDQLGLNAGSLAKHLGMNEAEVADALKEAPDGVLGAFLGLCDRLHVKMRLRAAPQRVSLWVRLSAIERLHRDDAWRKSVGLVPLPPNRGQLVAKVRFLRTRHKWTYGDILTHMERNYVPTAEGLRNWRGSTIGHVCNGGKVADAAEPLGFSAGFATAFRAMAARELLVRLFAFDPFAPVRYEVDAYEDSGCLVLVAGQPCPEFVPAWVERAMRDLKWFNDTEWGMGGAPRGLEDEEAEERGEGPDVYPLSEGHVRPVEA